MAKRSDGGAGVKPAAKAKTSVAAGKLRPGVDFDIQILVPYLFNRTTAGMYESFTASLKPYKLSIPMWRVLVILYGRGPLRFGTLATLSSTELPTLSRIISHLTGRKLMTRSKAGDDGRGVLLDITEAGSKTVREVIPHVIELENVALRGFSDDERYLARRLLQRICENVSPLRSHDTD
jgi:MarR family transcriptional regulator, organic hydroperoxide resistance regulator